MTMALPPDNRRKYLIFLVVSFVLTAGGMVYFARNGISMPNASRRVGSGRLITWDNDKFGFLFMGIPVLFCWFAVLSLLDIAVQLMFGSQSKSDGNAIYQSDSLSSTQSRVISAILSLLIPGLGQAFGTHYIRSAVWLLIFVVASIVSQILYAKMPTSVPLMLPVVGILLLRVASSFDASRLELNRPNIRWPGRIKGVAGFAIVYALATVILSLIRSQTQ